jgi:DNA polymerase (family 10)
VPVLERREIVARLREIAALLRLHGASRYKARAFERGAGALEACKLPLHKLIESGDLMNLPGVGFALAKQVAELFETGHSDLLESLREGLPAGALELSQVSGIGLHALRTLGDDLGVRTVEDLRRAACEGRLRHARGFGPKKEGKILAAIERHRASGPVRSIAEGFRLGRALEDEVGAMEGVFAVHISGSVRRFVELMEELHVVVVADDPAWVAPQIRSMPRVGSVERSDEATCRLRLADGTRVDVSLCTPEELATTLVLAVASEAHRVKLVARATSRGYALSPRGLFRDGARIPLATEHDLYAALGLSWVPPEMRNDEGEIEEAARGVSFDLVSAEDLRGFVHCHTTWSDGKHDLETMARAAENLGAEFITITDHSPAAHYAGGLDVERLRRQWDEIDAVQDRVAIRILRGTEADILADGALDWPDAVLELLDVVIASVHARHRQDESKMTERVVRAMRHPIFKIWGHPLGRLVPSRPPIPLRVEEALDALAESRGAIEINGDPHRLDLEPRWVRAARERGIPLVLSVDAHSTHAFANVVYAAGIARRAGVRRHEVLNTLPTAGFTQGVRPA